MTNRACIHEFHIKVNFEPQLSNLVIYLGDGIWPQMQNFISISLTLFQIGQKTGIWGVNTTIC